MERHEIDGSMFYVPIGLHRAKSMFARHKWGAERVWRDGSSTSRAMRLIEVHARRTARRVAAAVNWANPMLALMQQGHG